MNYTSSFSPTANYSLKGFIHLKIAISFFLIKVRCPLTFWRAKPAIRVSQSILPEEGEWQMINVYVSEGRVGGIITYKRGAQLCGGSDIMLLTFTACLRVLSHLILLIILPYYYLWNFINGKTDTRRGQMTFTHCPQPLLSFQVKIYCQTAWWQ